jgi:predicted alpha/beta hydrolase
VNDDAYAPRRAAEALFDLYPNAPEKTLVPVDARAHGGAIGHFGFFRERLRDSLWADAARWMEER